MMNYSKSKFHDSNRAQGLILVSKNENYQYHIHSQNIVSLKDKEKMEPILLEIQSLSPDGIKRKYRELRRNGDTQHDRGGGIGFYEIAKKCNSIEYNFNKISDDRYYFHIKTIIEANKGK